MPNPEMTELLRQHSAPGIDIAAGGKALPFARQNGNAHIGVRLHLVGRVCQRFQHIEVERIQLLRTRNRQRRNMIALGKAVFAYTNHPDDYGLRVRSIWYAGLDIDETSGRPRGPDGIAIENHGMADNLMIDGGVESTGGKVFRAAALPADPARDLAVYFEAIQTIAGMRADGSQL